MTVEWRVVTKPEDIQKVAKLADEIWSEHYNEILVPGQIAYMVEKFQSPSAITRQIEDGYEYQLCLCDGQPAGYYAIQPQGTEMFLSKIYIHKNFRHKGLARQAVGEIVKKSKGCDSIFLTVNKYNAGSIAAYEAMGFETTDQAVTDIGNGYVMDDYIMTKQL